jgi:hypothetical protein
MHDDEYFKYLLGDPSYLGEKMFIVKKIGRCEINLNANQELLKLTTKCMLGIECEWNGGLVD